MARRRKSAAATPPPDADPVAAVVRQPDGTYTITRQHTYAGPGAYRVDVRLHPHRPPVRLEADARHPRLVVRWLKEQRQLLVTGEHLPPGTVLTAWLAADKVELTGVADDDGSVLFDPYEPVIRRTQQVAVTGGDGAFHGRGTIRP